MSKRVDVDESESQLEPERGDDEAEDAELDEVEEEEADVEVGNAIAGELDGLPVLAAIQLLGEPGAAVEALQREIDAAGAGHHPRGVIWAVLMGLVEAGKIRQEGADEADSRFWIAVAQDPKAVLGRRMKIALTALRTDRDGGWPLGDLISEAGFEQDADRAEADVLALAAAGVFNTFTEGEGTYYGIVQETVERIEQLGVGLVIRAAFDSREAATDAPVDRSQFERAALERAELATKRAGELQATITTMRDNLRRADLNPDWFIAPPPPAMPPQEETDFTERRVVDAAEKGVILMEIIALDRKLAAHQAEFAIVKDEHKAKTGELEKAIAELKSAAESNARTIVIRARKERDWTQGVLRTIALDDGRVLDERPLPKGEQRTIPDAAAPQESPAPVPAVKAAVEAFVDEMAAKGVHVSAVREADGVSTINLTRPETPPAALVDMASLSKFERDVVEALTAEQAPVDRADIHAAVQRKKGSPVGPAAGAKLQAAADALAERNIIVRDGDRFRALGVANVKAFPAKTPKELVWDALTSDGKLKAELRSATGVTDDDVDQAIKELTKAGKIVTSGKARGTRYARAGANTEARA